MENERYKSEMKLMDADSSWFTLLVLRPCSPGKRSGTPLNVSVLVIIATCSLKNFQAGHFDNFLQEDSGALGAWTSNVTGHWLLEKETWADWSEEINCSILIFLSGGKDVWS